MSRAYPVTYLLMLINILVFIAGYSVGQDNIFEMGAMYGPNVAHGQWYRLLTSGFIHSGFAHIAVNMMSLYFMGSFTEGAMGKARMFLVYLGSLIASGAAIYYFSYDMPTVGASGAIFGLFGALFAIGIRTGAQGRQLIQQAFPILAINLAFTFFVPGISKAGHLGGLLAGFLLGLLLYHPPRPVYAQVVDTNTGEALESHIETP
ncbi:MAG: rhomboid family intramembrane serine protease [Candidatus Eremiobacteraeota bacterium]|nr:rhomboid family intramembrane serine protease [Candidatus Eremiobacteraeota bacterium]